MQIILWVFWLILQLVDVYTFCLLFSYLIKVFALLYFICCYQHVLVNKDIQSRLRGMGCVAVGCRTYDRRVQVRSIPRWGIAV